MMDLPPEHYYAKGKVNYRQVDYNGFVNSHYFKDVQMKKSIWGLNNDIKTSEKQLRN